MGKSTRALADESSKKMHDNQIKKLKETDHKLQEDLATLAAEKNALQETVKALEADLLKAKDTIGGLEAGLLKAKGTIGTLEDELVKKNRELIFLEDKVAKLSTELTVVRTELQSARTSHQREMQGVRKDIAELQRQVKRQKEDYDEALEANEVAHLEEVAAAEEKQQRMREEMGRMKVAGTTLHAAQASMIDGMKQKVREGQEVKDRLLLRQGMYKVRAKILQKLVPEDLVNYVFIGDLEGDAELETRWKALIPRYSIRKIDDIIKEATTDISRVEAHPDMRKEDRAAMERAADKYGPGSDRIKYLIDLLFTQMM